VIFGGECSLAGCSQCGIFVLLIILKLVFGYRFFHFRYATRRECIRFIVCML